MKNKSEYSSLGFFALIMVLILLVYFTSAGVFKDQILKRSELVEADSTGSVTAEGHKFVNKTEMQVYMMERGFNKFYPPYNDISNPIIIMLAAMSLAAIGVILNEIYDEGSGILLINRLLFGIFLGAVIWFIGERAFGINESGSGHNSVFIISLIAGTFASKILNGLKTIYKRSLSKRSIS